MEYTLCSLFFIHPSRSNQEWGVVRRPIPGFLRLKRGLSVFLSFRAWQGSFASADAIPRLILPPRGGGTEGDGEGMSSKRIPYPSQPRKRDCSSIPSFLLSKPHPFHWAAVWFRLRAGRECGCHIWQPYKVSCRPAIEAVGPPYMAAAFSRSACEKILRLRSAPLRMTMEGNLPAFVISGAPLTAG